MKKLIVICTLLFCFKLLPAPEYESLYISRGERINKFTPLIEAVVWVESSHGKKLYNKKENAVGWFQIRQTRVDDYNKRRGTSFKLEDFYDYNLSREMFLYYAGDKAFEQAAKDWNGSGELTVNYWNKIKKYL